MAKYLFFDIDGTLCMPTCAPTERTVKAIRSARARGHRVFLSTGRNLAGVPSAVKAIGWDGYITNAGASALVGEELLVDLPLPEELKWETLRVLQENEIFLAIQSRGNYTDMAQNERIRPLLRPQDADHLEAFVRILKMEDWNLHREEPIYKLCFIAPSYDRWYKARPWLERHYDITLFDNLFDTSVLVQGELNRKGTDKGKALRAICAHFGASAEDAIAFGDSTNDSAMLLAAGMGCAMANAQEEVKAIADRVCPHCQEDGVAQVLEELGLADPA